MIEFGSEIAFTGLFEIIPEQIIIKGLFLFSFKCETNVTYVYSCIADSFNLCKYCFSKNCRIVVFVKALTTFTHYLYTVLFKLTSKVFSRTFGTDGLVIFVVSQK